MGEKREHIGFAVVVLVSLAIVFVLNINKPSDAELVQLKQECAKSAAEFVDRLQTQYPGSKMMLSRSNYNEKRKSCYVEVHDSSGYNRIFDVFTNVFVIIDGRGDTTLSENYYKVREELLETDSYDDLFGVSFLQALWNSTVNLIGPEKEVDTIDFVPR